ncbi:hypothetical protein TVAG_050890 [Trichomonas vaginalis G3]|uniref:Wntless-like transmembrane domain-containing protein n=1 Tax=Trichomonas vaginalis (strain ATCC PRA-98 / G3) TaxID=412133 RepID=A2EEP8_TRIV3|nr:transmembrane protein 181 family [Trichomonas vaginalis G3]EAY08854.1 hypothetical protein TVAG_050890 [Trichomonas vaginalis G3]KAI5489349.1 transmembrane protein 181 family [Trichomonas vaginalis G3]|eukprot:XP_001321077.1 hypothetical protein [Trichomonas vaginalis G3]
MKPSSIQKEENDVSSDNMVAVEINDGYVPEYLMNLDKVNHKDDIIMFLLFLSFIIVNILVGILAPSTTNTLSKSYPVIVDSHDSYSIYSMGIESISPMNSYIKMRVGYRSEGFTNKSAKVLLNVSMKYTNPKSDHTKRAFKSSNVTFSTLPEQYNTNWHLIYFERIVDFTQVTAEIVVSGSELGFNTFVCEAIICSYSDSLVQIWIRIVYSIVLFVVLRTFNAKLKTVDVRHEQSLSSGLLFTTIFLNDPAVIANYIRPTLGVTVFDSIMRSFYTGYLALFVFVVLGHCGIKEKMMGDFITNRLSIAAVVGLVTITREFLLDLAQIYNPMMQIVNADYYLKIVEYIILAGCAVGIVIETVRSSRRIDEIEKFRLVIYVIASSLALFILTSVMGLIGEKTTLKFLATFGSANALAFAMTYAHYPFSIDNIEYKDAKNADIASLSDNENVGLLDNENEHEFLGKEETELNVEDIEAQNNVPEEEEK